MCFPWLLDFISSTVKMNKDKTKSCKQLNKKASLVIIPSQIKTVQEERRLKVLLLLQPLLLLFQYKCPTAISISKVQIIYYLTYQNRSLQKTNMVVSRRKEHKQKSRNTSLAIDENQYIYLYDKLVIEPTLTKIQTVFKPSKTKIL